jgi:hypothetical protein
MAVVMSDHQIRISFEAVCGLRYHSFKVGAKRAGALDLKWLIVLIALGAFVFLFRKITSALAWSSLLTILEFHYCAYGHARHAQVFSSSLLSGLTMNIIREVPTT